jgi:sugar lactone lactonase YvrE
VLLFRKHRFQFNRIFSKSAILCFAGLFVVLAHTFAQSLITTYVGPQLPVSGNPAVNQAVDFPSAIIPDGAGGIYVASTNQNRIYRIAADGILTLGAGSSYGFSGDGGPATDARLASPSGLAVDSVGNLYISDTGNNRIREVTTNGSIATIAGTGTAGFAGDGGPASSAELSGPTAIAVDTAGNVYIADTGNKRIRKVGVDDVINTVAGGGNIAPPVSGIPALSAQLSPSFGIAADPAGNLYIGDGFVLRVSPDGIMSTLTVKTYSQSSSGFPPGTFCRDSGDGGPVSAASVCDARGLALDGAGNLYVADSNVVHKITTDGVINTVYANTVVFPFPNPVNVAADAGGSLYIGEAMDNVVHKMTPDGTITTILGNTITGFAGDGGPATSAQLSIPGAIALDKAGNLYIADPYNARVRKVGNDGVIRTIAGSGFPGFTGDGGPATFAEIGYPGLGDIFVDSSNNVYFSDSQRVRKITTDGVIRTIAGNGNSTCSLSEPAPDGILATEAALCPGAIAVDTAGALYVAWSDRVQKVGSDGIITTSFVLEQGYHVTGFELDPAGGFYISDRNSSLISRIQKVTPDGVASTIVESDGCPEGPLPGPVPSDKLCYPTEIKLDGAGNLYVLEFDQRRIDEISPGGVVSTIAGNLVPGFSGDSGPAISAQLNAPTAIAVDATGNLYISDGGNYRIRKVSPSTASQSFTLSASSVNYRETTVLSGPIAVGYGTIQPVAGHTTPYGIAVYRYRPNGVLVSETAVPASPLRQSGRIYAESNGTVRTGIAIANPNDQDASISFYFTDKAGANLNGGTTTLPAHEQTAVFLDQQPFRGTATAQTFTFNSSVPVGVVALRSYVNERGEFLMTTLPVAPVSSSAPSSAGTLVLPHFAAGGGWTTQVLLVNPTDQALSGTVNMDAAYAYTIAPRSSVKIASADSASLRTGSIVINPAQGSGAPIVSSVFTFVNNGITVTETGIATTGVAPSFRLFAESDSTQRLQTGVAITNAAATAAKIQFELFASDGQSTGYVGSTTLDPNGHLALFLNQIAGLNNLPATFRGVLHISSNTSISAIGLRTRYNERGDFLISTTPAIADNTPTSTDEFVFPQVVSGSGYTTDFILMNTAGTSQGTLSLTSQVGNALPLFGP